MLRFKLEDKLLRELRKGKDKEIIDEILTSHKSTRERLNIYDKIYREIFRITGKPESILDLGCGINPISYPYLNCNVKYIAVDKDKEDINFVKKFFKIMKIKGKTKVMKIENINEFPEVDVTFLFKVLDDIDESKWRELIERLNSKFIVVSFAVKKLSGKKMREPRRYKFIMLLNKLKLKYKIVKEENEIFYIIQKL